MVSIVITFVTINIEIGYDNYHEITKYEVKTMENQTPSENTLEQITSQSARIPLAVNLIEGACLAGMIVLPYAAFRLADEALDKGGPFGYVVAGCAAAIVGLTELAKYRLYKTWIGRDLAESKPAAENPR